ncbi:MAG: nickel-dependent lactate racemase, partial [Thermodesulfobacteriota bacterium]|nr:nickel-dependent lactate racemase [Thermodesulfobacteriota bacterium]
IMRIFFGDKEYAFEIPDSWKVLNSLERPCVSPLINLKKAIIDSINSPINSPPLEKLLKEEERIVILIDDNTRSTPSREILKVLLPYLKTHGIKKENIDILICGGTHRLMTQNEINLKLGEKVTKNYRSHQHNASSSDLVSLSPITKNDHTLHFKINPLAIKAQVKIGIGSILPHHQSGFSGGTKIICPGICDYKNIVDHHRIFGYQRGEAYGALNGNLFYEISCEVARQVGLNFIINTVNNEKGEVLEVFSGDPFKAHAKGANFIKENFAVILSQKADITIISTYPYLMPPQNLKAIGIASMGTKKGGTIILFSPGYEIPEGILDRFIFFKKKNNQELQEIFKTDDVSFPGVSVMENYNIPKNVLYSRQYKIIYVNPEGKPEKIKAMGFIPASSISQAIELEKKGRRRCKTKDIVVLNQGILSYPLYKRN